MPLLVYLSPPTKIGLKALTALFRSLGFILVYLLIIVNSIIPLCGETQVTHLHYQPFHTNDVSVNQWLVLPTIPGASFFAVVKSNVEGQ